MRSQFIDLTHTLHPGVPVWHEDVECLFLIKNDYQTHGYKTLKLCIDAGVGTHIDAPSHFDPKGLNVDQIPIERLITSCVVVDVSGKATADYKITVDDIGEISKDEFVLFYTGWDRFWNEPIKYVNYHQFPSLTVEACEYLLKAKVVGIGIDTLSPDTINSGFPAHKILLSNGIYIVENVANAKKMPSQGGTIFVMPIKGEGLTEAPIRLVGVS